MSLAIWLALGGDASLVVGVVTVRVVTRVAARLTGPDRGTGTGPDRTDL